MAPQRPRDGFNQADNPIELDDGLTNRLPGAPPGPIATGDSGTLATAPSKVDARVDDENFLLCVVLCYVGLPPSMWRTITNHFLEAVSVEYRDQLGQEKGSQEFKDFKTGFQTWSTFNKVKTLLTFLAGEGIVGKLALRSAAAQAVRMRILEILVKCGVRLGTINGASQIIRKVSIYLELAWISGCAAYCGGMNYANAMITFSSVISEAVTAFVDLASAAGNVVVAAFIRPIIVAKAMLDPSNWDTTSMGKDALFLSLLGTALWPKLKASDGEAFLANLAKPLSSFGLAPSVISDVAAAMNRAYNARGGLQVTFTATLIADMTPVTFVQFLRDWRLIRFNKDPGQVADDELKKQGQP